MFTVHDLPYTIPVILISLALHEAMHAYAAHALGDDTAQHAGRLTLNPLKHIDLYTTIILPIVSIILIGFPVLIAKPVPFNPYKLKFGEYGAAIVAVAGPLSNLILAILAGLALRFFIFTYDIEKFLLILTEINVIYFVFNMIPIPPLDGSRLLYALSPENFQRIMTKIESFGYLTIFAIFILVFFYGTGPIYYCYVHLMNLIIG
jgi:Zn-dependent protease